MTRVPRPGDVIGRYRLVRELGRGGMGVVYAATDTRLDRPAALKVMLGHIAGEEAFLARFAREAATLARIESAHVIEIYDYGECDGLPYIATQYVDGGDLGSALAARGPLPPRPALEVCAQVAEGLAATHAAGVVHRDVKPGNILLRDPGAADLHVHLCDFGIAQTAAAKLTATGVVAGTWAYLAPERVQGAAGTPASDAYAVGCVLWECLTGATPYVGTALQMAYAHVSAPVPQLAGTGALAEALNRVLGRALAKDPGERYDDLRAMAGELRAALSLTALPGFEPRATVQPVPPALPRMRRRRGRVLAAVGAGVVVALVAGGAVWAVRGGDERPSGGAEERGRAGEVVTGDLDGDGLGDLAASTVTVDDREERVQWRSRGTAFGTGERTAAEGYLDAVAGDFDGDGRLDTALVSSSVEYEPAYALIDFGDGRDEKVAMELPQAPHDRGAQPTLVGDFDGDGRDDLAFAIQPEDADEAPPLDLETGRTATQTCTLWVVRDVAGKPPPAESWHEGVPCFVPEMAVGDLQGDGRADLVVLIDPDTSWEGSVSERPRLLPLLSDGSSLAAGALVDLAGQPYGRVRLTAGDLDGDGDDEVVAAVEAPDDDEQVGVAVEVRVHGADESGALGDGQVWLSTRRYEWGLDPALLSVSDVDGDGRDDVLFALVIDDALSYPEDGPRPGEDVPVDVLLSDGAALAEPAQWAVCAGCAGYFSLYGPVAVTRSGQ
ncbi:serine/threonine-protein kinase [Nocardioides humi]|uniref:non-specific serine/threonine protein kinase n=1 Tax=Nocardioides humi TaxID=449461 RepID=A0ABN2BCK0_9ACTN|nr:serine/threonine-protein kinase [Nocardioides humi]